MKASSNRILLLGLAPLGLLMAAACAGDEAGTGAGIPTSCGNGVVEKDEECDDGNDDDSDGCVSTCRVAKCGDDFLYEGVEECDDGNTRGGDGCSPDCKTGASALCGNGVLDPGETCDDGNVANNDGCLDTCVEAVCGDGYAALGSEQCDDGNDIDDDGCRNDCTLADGNPSVCPGIELSVSTASDVSVVGQTEGAGDTFSFSCGGSGAPDSVYTVVPKTDGWLIVTLAGLEAGDPLLAIRSDACESGQELACADASADNGAEMALVQVSGGGKYYVFVDGGAPKATAYTLTLHLQTEVPGDSCPGIPSVIGAGQEILLEGDTAAATSDYKGEAACSAAVSTKDVVHAVTPTQDGTLTFQLAPGFDGVLYARVGSCTHGMQVGCADLAGPGGAESFSINAVANTKYSVFVDGYNGAAGSYSLLVSLDP
jgi:cysteine-rich repeat protein